MADKSSNLGTGFIIKRENTMELSVQSCVDGAGILQLGEWDVLIFVYRRGASLISTDQVARLIGYDKKVVSDVLDRLERGKLIERSPSSRGVCFYRIPVSTGAGQQSCFRQIISLSKSRDGRLLLMKRLRRRRESEREEVNG
jgi:DNA-binding MarR family transcriptional regulator